VAAARTDEPAFCADEPLPTGAPLLAEELAPLLAEELVPWEEPELAEELEPLLAELEPLRAEAPLLAEELVPWEELAEELERLLAEELVPWEEPELAEELEPLLAEELVPWEEPVEAEPDRGCPLLLLLSEAGVGSAKAARGVVKARASDRLPVVTSRRE
jgi:hypothetical protein